MNKMLPFFFALDSTNYSRWLPVHLKNMASLPDAIKSEFMAGLWTVSKTSNKFSSIAIDQAHEMNNRSLKGLGGALGLFHNQGGLAQWLIVMPELSGILSEFGSIFPKTDTEDDEPNFFHHEMTLSYQKNVYIKANKFYKKIMEYGNPFDLDHQSHKYTGNFG